MGKKMFVGGLPYEVDEAKLRELFSPYGKVVGAKVIMDRETGRSKGFGFVEMATDDEAKTATDKLNNSALGERKIFVRRVCPVLASNGSVERLIGYGFDVTELRYADAAVRDSEKGLRDFIDNAPYGIYRSTQDTRPYIPRVEK